MFSLKGSWGLKIGSAECTSKARIDGKTVIITGGNTGIGKETAIDLAKRGGRVVICCRNAERAEKAVSDIKAASGSDNVDWYLMDLSSLQSVRDCSTKILEKESRIDILINNAGVIDPQYSKTVDGFENHMATNHLGHFLFTLLILPKIKNSEIARILNISSIVYQKGSIDFDDLHLEKSFEHWKAYSNSKLANVLFTRELARRLNKTNIRVYCLHPGIIKSEMGRNLKHGLLTRLFSPFLLKFVVKDVRQGAQTSIYCAVSEDVANESGLYYAECKHEEYHGMALDDDIAKRFWDLSIKLVNFNEKLDFLSDQ